jgi:hypothetical protein
MLCVLIACSTRFVQEAMKKKGQLANEFMSDLSSDAVTKQAILHFNGGLSSSTYSRLVRRAEKAHQTVEKLHDHAVRVFTSDAVKYGSAHDDLVTRYRRDRHRYRVAIFHDQSDKRHTRRSRFRPHIKWHKLLPGGEFHNGSKSSSQTAEFKKYKAFAASHPSAPTGTSTGLLSARSESKEAAFEPRADYGRTARALSQFYNLPPQQMGSTGSAKPVIAIISFDGFYRLSDLQTYWTQVCGYSTFPTVVNVSVDGATYNFSGSGSESENTLDLEIAGGICPAATLVFYSAPNTDTGFYNAVLAAIQGSSVGGVLYKPNVISLSWGSAEISNSVATLAAMNQLFQIASNQGITVVAAVGDDGSNDGVKDGQAHVDFPASSPWVVACGGTSIASNGYESVWSWSSIQNWGTGGGISAHFPAPEHQQSLGSLIPYPSSPDYLGKFRGNRTVPDISLNGDPSSGWTIVFNNQVETNIGGTSCVAPAVAGLIGLLNLNYTGGRGSFLALLYQAYANSSLRSSCFRDIVQGNNDNVSSGGFFGIGKGTSVFSATQGYDFCTGMGVPHGANLLAAFKQLTSSN